MIASGCLRGLSVENTLTIRLPENPGRGLDEEARDTGLPKGRKSPD